jgi:hypothetical protein
MIGERNLAPKRGPSVWDREEFGGSSSRRWLSGIGGAAIAITGAALAAVGGSMVFRAAKGRGISSSPPAPNLDAVPQQANRLEDVVARESAMSFPASDAPSWTPTTGATVARQESGRL